MTLTERQPSVHRYTTELSEVAEELPAFFPMTAEETAVLGPDALRNEALLSTLLGPILHFKAYGLKTHKVPKGANASKLRALKKDEDQGQSRLGAGDITDVGTVFDATAVALSAAKLAEEAAFFSTGSNDLSQFDLAMDSRNPAAPSNGEVLHLDSLPSIDRDASKACSKNRRVAACGRAVSDLAAARFPIGLGVTELTGTPGMTAPVKALIRISHLVDSRAWAGSALTAETSTDVRYLLSEPEEKMPTIINGLVSVSSEH